MKRKLPDNRGIGHLCAWCTPSCATWRQGRTRTSAAHRTSLQKLKNNRGFGLIELTMVIIIIGVLAAVAMQSATVMVQDARQVGTEREMEQLVHAITGDPSMVSNGGRTDFGYVGDVGSFPPNLQALYENPGGYSTWSGPYLPPGISEDAIGFKTDEWGTLYAYSGGTTIQSSGSGSTLTRKVADAVTDYTLNSLNGIIKDADDSLPGVVYMDSVDITVTIPNGSGGTATKSYAPDAVGAFTLDSLPVGTHPVQLIYTPNVDTLLRYVTILPKHKSSVSYKFASAYFSGGSGGGSGSEILRPTGVGSSSNLFTENCSNGWECVDEEDSDGDSTYVKGEGSQWNMDTHTTADHSVGSGTVDSIIVYVRAKGNGGGRKARTAIRIGGNNYTGSQNNTTSSYVDYSTTYLTNPATSAAWTWTGIDNLEIGVDLKKVAFCTQVWVEVFYTN